jgi:hypothetical protein
MRDIFNNYSSLKPLKDLKANLAGKFTLFISVIPIDLLVLGRGNCHSDKKKFHLILQAC